MTPGRIIYHYRLALVACLCIFLVACESVGYYSQAVSGQLNILRQRKSLEKIIEDPDTDPLVAAKLDVVLDIREFAETELSLEHRGNFGTYVDLGQRFVVWNVFAAPEFSMTPESWCYPIAGCVSYRGYFSEDRARRFADRQQKKGLEVYVGGVAAYSTLGWFSDPLLNTVINRDDYDLAGLIFHELAHQKVYAGGDTDFNESFATAVEREGLRRWLAAHYSTMESAHLYETALQDFERQEQFAGLVSETVEALDTLYASGQSESQMREQKVVIIQGLREAYANLKNEWGGYSGYDAWFAQPLNNAQLSTVATYYRWVPAFERLLTDSDGDLPRFYLAAEQLAAMPVSRRQERLQALMAP